MPRSRPAVGLRAGILAIAIVAAGTHAWAQGGDQAPSRTLAPAGNPESARVISVVSSIPLAVDLGRYDLAETAFAQSILVDYTSLWGGEPETMTPADLIRAWRALVPGFDATRHELRNVRAVVTGDEATATAIVDGRHWLAGELWRPIGTYRWTLRKVDGRWRVSAMTFAVTRELGDRGLVVRARERVQAKEKNS